MKGVKKFLKNQIGTAILAGAIIIAAGIVSYAIISKDNTNNKTAALESIINGDKYFQGLNFKDNEYILGNAKNDITLVVYSDLECPFCKMLQEDTIQKLQKEYGLDDKDHTKAKIGIVYRHFAQSYHTQAPTEINASLCTRELYGQNAYINFINRTYNVTPANNGLDLATVPDIAKYAVDEAKTDGQSVTKDFDSEEFLNCWNNNTYDAEYEADSNDALEAGLDGTPYTVILYKDGNGELVVQKISGARELSYFESIINKLLKI